MNPTQLLAHFSRLADAPDAISRLRQFVYELAYSGKLTPIPSDADWPVKSIDQLATEITPGFACSKTHQMNDGYVHLRTHNVATNGRLNFDLLIRVDPRKIDFGKASLRKNDIIFNNTNSQELVGKTCLVDKDYEYAFSNHLTRIRLRDAADPSFLVKYFTLLLRRGFFARLCNRWIGQAGINTATLRKIEIPLPPLAEQHRIVAKVDELMALCDRLEAAQAERESRRDRLVRASLHRLTQPVDIGDDPAFRDHARFTRDHLPRLTTRPEHIRQLRQTILNLAVRGKLVPQDPKDESAVELVKRIQTDKARLVKEGKIRKPNPLSPIDLENVPYGLPNGWAWARFPELGDFNRGKSRHRPRNDRILYQGGKYKLVQTGDVARANGVIKTHTGLYNDVGLAQSRLWPKGTMCITIAANIADSAILGFDACIPDSVVGFVPLREFENAKYFEFFMRTAKANLEDFAPSTAQKNINIGILETVLIPLPPLAEQHRIVAKVDELMALCDRLEGQLTTTQTESRRLLEAVLHEALAPENQESKASERVVSVADVSGKPRPTC